MSDVLDRIEVTQTVIPRRMELALRAIAHAVAMGYLDDHLKASAAVRDLARENDVPVEADALADLLGTVIYPAFKEAGWATELADDKVDRTDDPRFPFWVLTKEDDTPENRCNMEADLFALTFLMSPEPFEQDFMHGEGRLSALAGKYGVTFNQAAAQAICLGLIGEGHPEVDRRIVALPDSHVGAYRKKLAECRADRMKRLKSRMEKYLAASDPSDARAYSISEDPLFKKVHQKLRPVHRPVRFRQVSPCRTFSIEVRLLENGTAVRLLENEDFLFVDKPDKRDGDGIRVVREDIFRDEQVDEIAAAAVRAVKRFPDPMITALKVLPHCKPNRFTDCVVGRAFGWLDVKREDEISAVWERHDIGHLMLPRELREERRPPRFTVEMAAIEAVEIEGWTFEVSESRLSSGRSRYTAKGHHKNGRAIKGKPCLAAAAALCHAKIAALAVLHGLAH